MKIYIASSFNLINKVEELSKDLEAYGHKITCKWWSIDNINLHKEKADNLHPDNFYGNPFCKQIFERDYKGVKDCDIFIFVAGDIPTKFNGANIELGLAYALGKDCFSIGNLENCALYYPIFKMRNKTCLVRFINDNYTFKNESSYKDIYDNGE